MTAYGYLADVFDALYAGDAHELNTLCGPRRRAPMPGATGARSLCNFLPLQLLWFGAARRARSACSSIGLSARSACGWSGSCCSSPRSIATTRLLLGRLPAELLGMEPVRRDDRRVPGALPALRPLPADDLGLRDQGSGSRGQEASACVSPWPGPIFRACLPSSIAPEALIEAVRRARGGRLSPDRGLHALPGRGACRGAGVPRRHASRWLTLPGGVTGAARLRHAGLHQPRLPDRRWRPSAARPSGLHA